MQEDGLRDGRPVSPASVVDGTTAPLDQEPQLMGDHRADRDVHRAFMREKKRQRDRERRRLETIELRKKVASGEITIHPEAIRARKRRKAKQKPNDEQNVATILVDLLTDLKDVPELDL